MTGATHLSARTLTWPDYATLALYFAASLGIGWWCARRRRTGRDFFLAGRKVAWWAAAISFFATGASSISFMALPAKTYQSDWMYFGSGPAQSLAGVAVGLVFVAVLRRLNLTTIFDYLERRFNRPVRWLGGALAVLLKICGRMSVVMLLPALALATVTGMNVYASIVVMGLVTTIYAMEGGFEAVVWTDVMQVAVTFGGVATALWFMAHGVTGGLGGIVDTGLQEGKFHMVSWAPNVTDPTMWVFVGMFFGSVFTQLGDQPLMQRALATADPAAARRTVVLGTLIGIPSTIVFFFVGTALAVFYQHHRDRLSAALPNDAIFPYFIVNELPHGVVGLIIAGLFAAAMGALSSAMNSTAAVVVTDFYDQLRPNADPRIHARWARGSTLVAGMVATLIAAGIASLNVQSLWDEYLKLLALIGGGFPGVFALGLVTRRANAPGVIVGALASIAVTWWVQTYTSVSALLDAFIAIASCMLVGYVASLCFRSARQPASLRGLTLWDMRPTPAADPAPLGTETAPAK